jgi:hypothetical protein
MSRVWPYLLARAKEASTWRGLVLLATGCGASLNPDLREGIVTGGLLLAGVLGAVLPDAKP